MIIERKSPFSGKVNQLDLPITYEELNEWRYGRKPIQEVFPYLTPSEREFLMTGITEQEWEETFGSEDD